MEIGISTIVFGCRDIGYAEDCVHIISALKKLNAIGYKSIEINTSSLPHPFWTKNKDMKRIAELIDSLDLKIISIHIGNAPGDIGSQDAKVRQEAIQWIEKSIEFCQILKPQYAGIHHGGYSENLSDDKIRDSVKRYIAESTGRIARFARKRGTSLLLETDLFRIKEVNQILDSVLEENVGILVDVGHCWHRAREEPSEVIREAANRLFLLHINDNNGKEDDHLIPGEGAINWGNILKALEKVSYKGIFMMECFNSRITKDNNAIARLAKKASEKLLGRQIISD